MVGDLGSCNFYGMQNTVLLVICVIQQLFTNLFEKLVLQICDNSCVSCMSLILICLTSRVLCVWGRYHQRLQM